MATGYEARQGGRNSFAVNPPAPVQTTTGASGESRGVQVVGGESIGGVEGGMNTNPGNVAAGLGEYFGKLMEPAIARKQRANFWKGYTEAQSGRALGELTENDSPLTKIFGPSGFAQGAQFYTGRQAIETWQQEQLADIDNLKRMSPVELSKHLADSSEGILTGDPYADDTIMAGMLEAQGPLIQTVTKERFKWMQDEAVAGASNAANAGATSLQKLASANAKLGEGADTEAIGTEAKRFLGVMSKPEGMTDENYQKFLYGFMRNSMAQGNFYAVELLRTAGISQVLTDDQQRQLEGDYDRNSKKVLADAVNTPEMIEELLKLDALAAQAEMKGGEQASAAAMVQGLDAINKKLRDATGVSGDYFDAEDKRSAAKGIFSAIVSRYNRAQSRAEALEDRAADRASAQADRDAEVAERLGIVRAAWQAGGVTAAIAGGASSGDFNTVAMEDFTQGRYQNIAGAYVNSGWKADGVATQAQAMVRLGLGEKYTEATNQAYTVWKDFNKINPELAQAYFGDYHYALTTFDRLVTTGTPRDVAYLDAFASKAGYGASNLPPQQRREAEQALTSIVSKHSSSWLPTDLGGVQTLNPAGQKALTWALTDDFTRLQQFQPGTPEQLAKQAYGLAINSGRFERYGKLGWANAKTGKPISELIGLKGRDADEVITAAAVARAQQVGGSGIGAEDLRIIRAGNNLLVQFEVNGVTKHAVADINYLKATATGFAERRRSGPNSQVGKDAAAQAWNARKAHAERYIQGESVFARSQRVHRELYGRNQ